jgi:hypothetical protein
MISIRTKEYLKKSFFERKKRCPADGIFVTDFAINFLKQEGFETNEAREYFNRT